MWTQNEHETILKPLLCPVWKGLKHALCHATKDAQLDSFLRDITLYLQAKTLGWSLHL